MGAPLSSSAPMPPQQPVPRRRLHAVGALPADPEQAPPDNLGQPPPIGPGQRPPTGPGHPAPAGEAQRPASTLPRLLPSTVGTIAVFAFEATEGTRQVGQLGKWITARVASELSALRALNVERRSLFHDHRRIVPAVRSVRATTPLPGVTEAAVVLLTPSRARAVALRFELLRGRWQATAITVL